MSLSSKITDDEMRYFQFKARQLYLIRKEDHDWNEYCKKNTCICCTCQANTVPKVQEVAVQSSPKRILPASTRNSGTVLYSNTKNLPQTLNEIKIKLERIDLTLSEMKVPTKSDVREVTKPKEPFNQKPNSLIFPIESDMAESMKSVINERKMQLIQDSLKMSLQRLHSAALRNSSHISNVKKKKSCGYFIPRELERKRAAARQAYLASLEKTVRKSKTFPHSIKEKSNAKIDGLKSKLLKTTSKSKLPKVNKTSNQKEEECKLVESNNLAETKDENIEAAIDAIMDDVLAETVLVINKIKQSKSETSSSLKQNIGVPNNLSIKNVPMSLDSKEVDAAMVDQFQSKLDKIKQHLHCVKKETDPSSKHNSKSEFVEIKNITKVVTNATESEQIISSSTSSSIQPKSIDEIKNIQSLKELKFDSIKCKQISKCRKEYWSYLERISRTKKGNFDPWSLSNLVAESLLDDCIQEISEELQDVPTSLIVDLYDQEFLQSI